VPVSLGVRIPRCLEPSTFSTRDLPEEIMAADLPDIHLERSAASPEYVD